MNKHWIDRLLPWLAFSLAVLVLGLAFFWQPEKPERLVPKVSTGGDFTLLSAQGPVSLKDFQGKLLLLYFGYTYCPDICPTSLTTTVAGLSKLATDERARVQLIFVSVDPERDTPARLAEYVQFFDPGIIGVTGDAALLTEMAGRYGVFFAVQKAEKAGGAYVVDHSADTILVGSQGKPLGKLAHGLTPDEVAAQIRQALNLL